MKDFKIILAIDAINTAIWQIHVEQNPFY